MDRELFERHGEGLIATSGCLGSEVNQRLLKGDRKGAAATWPSSATCSGPATTSSSCTTTACPSSAGSTPT